MPVAYNLGVALGWKRFAFSGDVEKVDLGTAGGRESVDLGVSYRIKNFTTRVAVGSDRATPNTPIAAGNRIPGIPRTSMYAELAWAHRPWGLETALEWRRVAALYVDDRNTDAAPSSSVLNLRLSLAQQTGRWSLREFLRVDNIANRGYVGSVIVNEGNSRFFEPAPRRTWLVGVNAGYQF